MMKDNAKTILVLWPRKTGNESESAEMTASNAPKMDPNANAISMVKKRIDHKGDQAMREMTAG